MVSKAIWVGGSEEQKKGKSQCDNGNDIGWKTVTKSSYHLNNSLKYIKNSPLDHPQQGGGGDVRRWDNVMSPLSRTFTVDLANYSQIIHISLSYNFPRSASFDFSVFSNFNSSILNSWFLVSHKDIGTCSFIAFCLSSSFCNQDWSLWGHALSGRTRSPGSCCPRMSCQFSSRSYETQTGSK